MVDIDKEEIWNLLAKHLYGETTADEAMVVELLLQENPNLREFYGQLETDLLSKTATKATAAFAKLDSQIKKTEKLKPGKY